MTDDVYRCPSGVNPGELRSLTEQARQDIRRAFLNLTGAGVPETQLAVMLAGMAIAYLELPERVVADWYRR